MIRRILHWFRCEWTSWISGQRTKLMGLYDDVESKYYDRHIPVLVPIKVRRCKICGKQQFKQ